MLFEPPEKVNFKGSISYCSINVLRKQYPSRRDDLESLIYVILHLYYGKLPWHDGVQNLRGNDRLSFVINMKLTIGIKDYGENIPKSILKIFSHIRSLEFNQTPDYDKLKFFIIKDLEQIGCTPNTDFEWINITSPLRR